MHLVVLATRDRLTITHLPSLPSIFFQKLGDAIVFYRYGVGTFLSNKAHVAPDTARVITTVAVSPSADHDTTMLPEFLERREKNLGTPPALAGDAHYGSNRCLWSDR
jgi:hypothetical protein